MPENLPPRVDRVGRGVDQGLTDTVDALYAGTARASSLNSRPVTRLRMFIGHCRRKAR